MKRKHSSLTTQLCCVTRSCQFHLKTVSLVLFCVNRNGSDTISIPCGKFLRLPKPASLNAVWEERGSVESACLPCARPGFYPSHHEKQSRETRTTDESWGGWPTRVIQHSGERLKQVDGHEASPFSLPWPSRHSKSPRATLPRFRA